jgi:hypothetical protein
MRPVRDLAVLVMLVVLATVGMRVLTWQPVQATVPVISTPTPVPEAGVLAYLQCVDTECYDQLAVLQPAPATATPTPATGATSVPPVLACPPLDSIIRSDEPVCTPPAPAAIS